MKAAKATFPAFGIDTVQVLSTSDCRWLVREGYHFVIRYLGGLETDELQRILCSGLAVMPVTYARDWADPDKALRLLGSLGIPKGVHVWDDLEGRHETPDDIMAGLDRWSAGIVGAGWQAGLYVGAGGGLSSKQLWERPHFNAYWRSASTVPVPDVRGFTMYQLMPVNHKLGPVIVDVDVVEQDHKGCLPTWVVT